MTNENPLRIEYSPLFKKQLKEVPQEIKSAFSETRELFDENPNDPALRNHKLKGRFASFRSIDVTEDYRALFKTMDGENETVVTFHLLGTHEQLYGKI
mgnify:CR=1 FL=1